MRFWPLRVRADRQAAGLIGKIPACADFVRETDPNRAIDAFDAWLVTARERLPDDPSVAPLPHTHFCFQPARAAQALIGVLAPSRDAAGRAFPAAVFRAVDGSTAQAQLAQLMPQSDPFLTAASALLAQAHELELDQMRQALAELPAIELDHSLPKPARLQPGQTDAAGFLEGVFGDGPAEVACYGLWTFVAAFNTDRRSGASAPALDCPVRDGLDMRSWLSLAARLSGRREPPISFFCVQQPARLLMSLSDPAPDLLFALAEPRAACSGVWPLHTQCAESIASARAALLHVEPELRSACRGSLPDLWHRLELARPRLAQDPGEL